MNIEDFEKKLNNLEIKMIRIEEHVAQNQTLLENIYIKLFGNGQEGILTTLTKHKVYFALIGASLTGIFGCLVKMFI